MRLALLTCAILATSVALAARLPGPAWEAVRAQSPPTVDGRLDDPCWQGLAAAGGFRELSGGAPAAAQTSFLILYDNQALYMALACQGAPAPGEALHIVLDPAASRQGAAHLRISAAGQLDDAWVAAGSPDPEWQSGATAAASVSEDGWCAELRLPFSSLRLAGQPRALWGLAVAREPGRGPASTWVPGAGPDFVRPRAYGRLGGIQPAFPTLGVSLGQPRLEEPAPEGEALDARLVLPYRSAGSSDLGVIITAVFEQLDGATRRTEFKATLRPGEGTLKQRVSLPAAGFYLLSLEVRGARGNQTLVTDRCPVTLAYEPLTIALDSPAYRDCLYAGSPERQISGRMILDLPRNLRGGAQVAVTLNAGETVLAAQPATAVPGSNQVPFAFAAESLAAGDYTLRARVLRQGAMVATAERRVRRLKARENEVTPGPDGRLRIGALPFTPLALVDAEPDASLARTGINTVVLGADWWASHGPDQLGAALDAARDCGLRVIAAPCPEAVSAPSSGDRGTLSAEALDAAAGRVEAFTTHSALLAWLVADGPRGAARLQSLRGLYQLIADRDPSHPCVALDTDPASLVRLTSCADVLCLAVGRGSLGQQPALAADIAALAQSTGKPVWIAPRTDFDAEPSMLRELRCLSYLALASGATGLVITPDDPAITTACRESLGPEIAILTPFWHDGVAVTDLGSEVQRGKGLIAKAWRLGDAVCILAVNPSPEPARARLSLPGLGERRFRVLSEDRFCEPVGEAITDEFEPFAVHLYSNGRSLPSLLSLDAVERHIINDQAALGTAW